MAFNHVTTSHFHIILFLSISRAPCEVQKIAETSAFSPSKGQIDHPVALAGNITTTSSDDCQPRKISQTVSSSHHCHRNKNNNNNKNYQTISSIKHKRKKQKPTNASSSSSTSVKIVLPCQLGALSEENEMGEHPNNRVLGACRIMVQPTLPYPNPPCHRLILIHPAIAQ